MTMRRWHATVKRYCSLSLIELFCIAVVRLCMVVHVQVIERDHQYVQVIDAPAWDTLIEPSVGSNIMVWETAQRQHPRCGSLSLTATTSTLHHFFRTHLKLPKYSCKMWNSSKVQRPADGFRGLQSAHLQEGPGSHRLHRERRIDCVAIRVHKLAQQEADGSLSNRVGKEIAQWRECRISLSRLWGTVWNCVWNMFSMFIA